MSPHKRIGVHIIYGDIFYWNIFRSVLYQLGAQSDLTLVPINMNFMDVTITGRSIDSILDEVLKQNLDVLISAALPSELALYLLNKGLPLILAHEVDFSHPLVVSLESMYRLGSLVGEYVVRNIGERGNVFIVGGLSDPGEAGRSRLAGLNGVFEKYPKIKTTHAPTLWTYGTAYAKAYPIAREIRGSIDAIVGIMDEPTLAGRDIAGITGHLRENTCVVGINASPPALDAIENHKVSAVLDLQAARLAEMVFDFAGRIVRGETISKKFEYPLRWVTPENVREVQKEREEYRQAEMGIFKSKHDEIEAQYAYFFSVLKELDTIEGINQLHITLVDKSEISVVLDLIRGNYGYDRAFLYRWDQTTREFVLHSPEQNLRIPFDRAGIIGDALESMQIQYVAGSPFITEGAPEPGMRSRLLMSLWHASEKIGVMDFWSKKTLPHYTEYSPFGFLADLFAPVIKSIEMRNELIAAKTEAQEARRAAEIASQAKSRFLANMTHEIRTPINAILGLTQLLQAEENWSEDKKQKFTVISNSADHLLELINDILDMSRIEAGGITVNFDVFSLSKMIDDIEAMFRLKIESKDLTFIIEKSRDLPESVITDEKKVRQILINLLGNAVKFTDSGRITLRVGIIHSREAGLRLLLDVEDTGPGIDKDELKLIFQAFQQAGAGSKAGGSGLGLAISHEFAALLGGSLTVESRPGQGSCFRLDIAIKEPVEGEKSVQPVRKTKRTGTEWGKGFTVLVADDNQSNRLVLSEMLRRIGCSVLEAENGEEAVRLFQEHHPALVMMDMRMPVMDGYEAARLLKADPSGKTLPVIAVTASAFEDDRQAVFDAGFDAYLRKPYNMDDLYSLIKKVLKIS